MTFKKLLFPFPGQGESPWRFPRLLLPTWPELPGTTGQVPGWLQPPGCIGGSGRARELQPWNRDWRFRAQAKLRRANGAALKCPCQSRGLL